MNDQDVRQLGEQLQQSLSALCAAHSVELRSFTATPVRLTDGGLTLFAVAVLNQQPMVPVAAMRAIRRLIGTSGQVNDSQNTTLLDAILMIQILAPTELAANLTAFFTESQKG